MSVRDTLARNTAFNAAGRTWEALASLVLLAYVVPRIGVGAWGLWALVSPLVGYVALFDFGIASSYSKYIAEHAARDEDTALSSVVSTGLFFYLFFGVILVGVGWPFIDGMIALAGRLPSVDFTTIKQSGALADARFLFRWSLVLFAASMCVGSFTSIQTGLQRMGVTNLLSFVASLVKLGSVIAFARAGWGVKALLAGEAAAFAVFGLCSIALGFRLYPGLRVSPTLVRWKTFLRLLNFGWRTQVARLSNLVMFQTDKVVAGLVYMQFTLVGVYDLGLRLPEKMRQVPVLLMSALVPAASDLDARGDEARLRELYLRSTKYVAVVTVPLVAVTAGLAGPLLRAWLGSVEGLPTAILITRILAVGYMANVLPGPGVGIVLGCGRPELQMRAGLISMVSNIVLTVMLVAGIGFVGIPLATALSMYISTAWFFRAMRRVVDVPVILMLRQSMLWPLVAIMPGLLVCMAGDWWSGGWASRWGQLAVVVVCGGFLTASYALILRFTPFLDAFDLDFLANTLRLRRLPGFAFVTRGMGGALRAGDQTPPGRSD